MFNMTQRKGEKMCVRACVCACEKAKKGKKHTLRGDKRRHSSGQQKKNKERENGGDSLTP